MSSIGSVGFSNLYSQVQNAKNVQQSFATNSLKGAMEAPQQFLQLLEQSVAVGHATQAASNLGMNVDARV
jgi:hypothetical protein